MNIKKILFTLSSVGIMALTSCGGSGLKHKRSSVNPVYHVDLNHDGTIADFDLGGETIHEDGLTWIEAYDTLISEANSMKNLNDIADTLKIAKSEIKRTSLARYEILHQAEELVMSTGAIIPLYNYGDPYLLKPNITGAYTMNLGYKYFDRLHYTDGTKSKDFNISVGTKAETFDPASNSDVSTCLAMNQFLIGAKRYADLGTPEEGERPGIDRAELSDGVCDVKKKLVTEDVDDEEHISIDNCPDLKQAIDAGLESKDDYIGTARYTITMKDTACWNNGDEITADDFIYEWTRASSGVYNGQAFGMWCNMFDMIRGYSVWNTIGQQKTDDTSKWSKDDRTTWNKLNDAQKNQWLQSWAINKCAGGMAGVIKNSEKEFTVQLINDCDYFESVLAFTAFMPVPKKNVIIVPTGKTEKDVICKEHGDWWLNKKGEYLTNGPMQIDGPIDNNDSGGINLKKAEHTTSGIGLVNPDTVDSLHFKFIDKDSTIYDSYKSGTLHLINQFPSSVIGDLEKKPDWCVAQQLGLFFYGFNVNDNTFDIKREADPVSGERNREKLRQAANLLVNRDDIAYNVSKKGSTPANGFVSDGVTETCIPDWDPTGINPITGEATGAYIAKRSDGVHCDTANWHERNKDMYSYLGYDEDPDEAEYNKHNMINREPGGFIPISDKEAHITEEEVMRKNTAKAIELAEEAGVHYDKKSGKFTNFPRINISTNNGSGLEDIAERIQAYYSLWGIDATIQTMEWQSFTAARRIGDFACAREGWVADYNDARTYLDLCASDSGNNDSQLGKDSWHSSH